MKRKQISDIKYGDRVYGVIFVGAVSFQEICMKASLDKHTVQKTLADLQKHGYISKDDRSLYRPLGDKDGQEKV